MKVWSEEEIEKALDLIRGGKTYKEISEVLSRSEGSIRNKVNEFGESSNKYYDKSIVREIKKCLQCDEEFEGFKKDNRKFCSQSCNAKFHNFKRGDLTKLKLSNCKNCDSKLENKRLTFCSKKCHKEHKRNEVFKEIENGNINLNSDAYKKYLIFKYGAKYMDCGWGKINPVTQKIPIQLDHIDGNSENNSLDNLRLLCPNCHSLTPTYGFLNKGKGRSERQRYRESLKKKTIEELLEEYNKTLASNA